MPNASTTITIAPTIPAPTMPATSTVIDLSVRRPHVSVC